MPSLISASRNCLHCMVRKSPPRGLFTIACCKTYPSWMGMAEVCVAPESTTSPVDLPLAKAARTAVLAKKKAGTLYFSNMSSVSFSLRPFWFQAASEKSTGWFSDSDLMILS